MAKLTTRLAGIAREAEPRGLVWLGFLLAFGAAACQQASNPASTAGGRQSGGSSGAQGGGSVGTGGAAPTGGTLSSGGASVTAISSGAGLISISTCWTPRLG